MFQGIDLGPSVGFFFLVMNLNSSQSVRPTIPVWRWAGLTCLIVAELVSLSLRYDAKTVPKSMPWHALAYHTGELARIGLAMLLATVLVAGPVWYRNLKLAVPAGIRLLSLGWRCAAISLHSCASTFCRLACSKVMGRRGHQPGCGLRPGSSAAWPP